VVKLSQMCFLEINKSVKDLPDFKSYDMTNRTYKYFKGDPLYPFGHGLSYTNFTYSDLEISDEIKINEEIPVTVKVTNSGDVNGDEVVQLYISHSSEKSNTARHSLVGFKRINLKAGQTKEVNFTITPKQYAIITEKGEEQMIAEIVQVHVGGKQPNLKNTIDAKTTQVMTKELILK